MEILSADDWCPAQGAAGGWVMLGLVFKWFPLWEFSLFDAPWPHGLDGRESE